jgi:hypothetical protein
MIISDICYLPDLPGWLAAKKPRKEIAAAIAPTRKKQARELKKRIRTP